MRLKARTVTSGKWARDGDTMIWSQNIENTTPVHITAADVCDQIEDLFAHYDRLCMRDILFAARRAVWAKQELKGEREPGHVVAFPVPLGVEMPKGHEPVENVGAGWFDNVLFPEMKKRGLAEQLG